MSFFINAARASARADFKSGAVTRIMAKRAAGFMTWMILGGSAQWAFPAAFDSRDILFASAQGTNS
jgi:hypothetical protein